MNNTLLLRARAAPLTMVLIAISVIVALATSFGSNHQALYPFLISKLPGHGLPEVLSGEIWRLITPIFIHYGAIHILFNMLWLFDLGSAVEIRQRSPHLGLLIGIMAILSNLSQYFWTGTGFGGMSGVVYGLLGYVWIQGRLNPRGGLELHPQIAVMMLIWFIICWLGIIGNVANMAHTVGLLAGLSLGWIFSPNKRFI